VLRGDLQSTPLADLLQRLSGAKATGCVYLLPSGNSFDAEEATVTLRDGAIYGVTLPRSRDALGTRLIATNRISPAALAEAKLAQETELASWALADLLIHLGLADEQHVQTITGEQAMADLTEISGWDRGSWRFRRSARLVRNLPSPLPVDEALIDVGIRRAQWRDLLPTILGADAIVSLAANPAENSSADAQDELADESSLAMDAEAFALLCGVDGIRTIAELASASGFTVLDAAGLIAQLVKAGLVQVTREMTMEEMLAAERAEAAALSEEDASATGGALEDDRALDALAAAFTFDDDGRLLPEDMRRGFSPIGAAWEDPSWTRSDPLADALARVSAALSEAMIEPKLRAESATEDVVENVEDVVEDEPAEDAVQLVEEVVEAAVGELVEELESVDFEPEPVAQPGSVAEPEVAELEAAELEVAAEPEVAEAGAEPEPAAPEELTRAGRADNAAQASRMLSQLAGDAGTADQTPEAEPEPDDEPAAEETPAAPAGYTPAPRRQTGPADTAALLRELSSLGAENGGGSSPHSGASRSASRPSTSSAASQPVQQRKRKGLFGRS
jgi:hypothetical protein